MKVDSEEKVVPFNSEWREKVLKELRDGAAARREKIRQEKSAIEERLAVVEGRIELAERQLRDSTAERDDLQRALFKLQAEDDVLKNSLGGS
jgi:chromosome segregation ATPase